MVIVSLIKNVGKPTFNFTDFLHFILPFTAENHFIFSYTSLGHSCDENPAQESFHASLKKEWLSTRILYHYEDAYQQIFDYIEGFYNPKRLHSSIGYVSPIEYEKNYILEKNNAKTLSK